MDPPRCPAPRHVRGGGAYGHTCTHPANHLGAHIARSGSAQPGPRAGGLWQRHLPKAPPEESTCAACSSARANGVLRGPPVSWCVGGPKSAPASCGTCQQAAAGAARQQQQASARASAEAAHGCPRYSCIAALCAAHGGSPGRQLRSGGAPRRRQRAPRQSPGSLKPPAAVPAALRGARGGAPLPFLS